MYRWAFMYVDCHLHDPLSSEAFEQNCLKSCKFILDQSLGKLVILFCLLVDSSGGWS